MSPTSREVLPAVIGVLVLCNGDVEACIVEGASFGRDADTIATVLGGLAGALQGASRIRRDWLETCESANAGFFQELTGDPSAGFEAMARRLVAALEAEQRKTAGRAASLSRLLRPQCA